MKRLTAITVLCVLFLSAFAAGKGPAGVPGYPDSLRSVWLYTEGIKQNAIARDTVRAREFFAEAIRNDSTFAPAYYEMAANGMYSTPDAPSSKYCLQSSYAFFHAASSITYSLSDIFRSCI